LAAKRKFYWDSCAWLGLINEEADKLDACRHVIDLARNGHAEIWTSTYTLAEVFKRKCENVQTGLDEANDYIFEEFLEQDFVIYAQVDADVGRLARRLLRKHAELKKPPDAVHLATAILYNCDEFHTTDEDNLLPLNGRIIRLDRQPLVICRPPEPPPPPPPPAPDLFSQVQDADTNRPAIAEPTAEGGTAAPPEAAATVPGGGEGTGVPGGRRGVRPGADADSVGGAGAEASTEEEAAETVIDASPPMSAPKE
jgi:predicted nucleic acid-binding protein